MKPLLSVVSVLAISVLSLSSIAQADPVGIHVAVQCPDVNALSNNGDFVAGYGQETIENKGGNNIYFKSDSIPDDLSYKLDGYRNDRADYNSITGVVQCSYKSMWNDPSFAVSYTLTNGKGGTVANQSPNNINLILPFGFKA